MSQLSDFPCRALSLVSASVRSVLVERLGVVSREGPKHVIGVLVCTVLLLACRGTLVEPGVQAVPAGRLESPLDQARLHVLMLNGGGRKEQNYRSHLLHLAHAAQLLQAAGVPLENFAVFSGDGENPEPDLAVRQRQPRGKHFWLVEGTPALAWLRAPVEYQNTTLAPFKIMPATREALAEWFTAAKLRLKPGDTLFLFVTDHGTKNDKDPGNNFIMLWGHQAQLSVDELRAWLLELDPEVRVVMLMSQCFSGAFARLTWTRTERDEPAGNVCGFFASTSERRAYGCYPENLGRNNVGHAFHMLRGWVHDRSLYRAHDRVLSADDTPDVPIRTSDLYLESLLRRYAEAKRISIDDAADALLHEAWLAKERWESDLRLLDSIGQAYGMFSARSLAELAQRSVRLTEVADQLRNVSRSWRGAWHDANRANWQRFLERHPQWRSRLAALDPAKLSSEERDSLAKELLPALQADTKRQPKQWERLRRLWLNTRAAESTSYRMEVRQAALLRMRSILLRVAGFHYLEAYGSPEERGAHRSLVRCEDLALPSGEFPEPGVRLSPPFPAFDEDVARAQAALPAWLGIQFRPPNEDLVRAKRLPEGAATVVTVYPGSPAQAAGLEPGDIVLGIPGQPFLEKGEVRSWVMLSTPGEALELEIFRQEQRRTVRVVAGAYPLRWPSLPGPPKVGSMAPPLEVVAYRGNVPQQLGSGRSYLLFFWATWCGACKASLEQVLAFAEKTGTEVVAITDESRTQVDAFFQRYQGAFPSIVAIDEFRKAFVAYGVSGTPTFVVIDGDGRVQGTYVGYDAKRGLPFGR